MALTGTTGTLMEEEERMTNHSTHEMTIHDIKDTFKKDFEEEIHDSNKYCNMADAAEAAGNEELAHYLCEMAYDEFTHAKFIHTMLVDWGYDIPEKTRMEWYELKERAERKFRNRR